MLCLKCSCQNKVQQKGSNVTSINSMAIIVAISVWSLQMSLSFDRCISLLSMWFCIDLDEQQHRLCACWSMANAPVPDRYASNSQVSFTNCAPNLCKYSSGNYHDLKTLCTLKLEPFMWQCLFEMRLMPWRARASQEHQSWKSFRRFCAISDLDMRFFAVIASWSYVKWTWTVRARVDWDVWCWSV